MNRPLRLFFVLIVLGLITGILTVPRLRDKGSQLADSIFSPSLKILGRVQDESGQPIAGATIDFTLRAMIYGDGTPSQTTSNRDGLFQIQASTPAAYIRATSIGYEPIPGKSDTTVRSRNSTSIESPVLLILKKHHRR